MYSIKAADLMARGFLRRFGPKAAMGALRSPCGARSDSWKATRLTDMRRDERRLELRRAVLVLAALCLAPVLLLGATFIRPLIIPVGKDQVVLGGMVGGPLQFGYSSMWLGNQHYAVQCRGLGLILWVGWVPRP
jgi:hypothetical protein